MRLYTLLFQGLLLSLLLGEDLHQRVSPLSLVFALSLRLTAVLPRSKLRRDGVGRTRSTFKPLLVERF